MKNFKFVVLVLVFIGACGSSEENKTILDVPSLRGKTSEEVIAVLGKPDTTYNRIMMGNRYFTQIYRKNNTEIKYQDGKLTSIIINEPDLEFTPGVITRYGFTEAPPTLQDSISFFNWTDLDSISNISVYKVEQDSANTGRVAFKIYFNME